MHPAAPRQRAQEPALTYCRCWLLEPIEKRTRLLGLVSNMFGMSPQRSVETPRAFALVTWSDAPGYVRYNHQQGQLQDRMLKIGEQASIICQMPSCVKNSDRHSSVLQKQKQATTR